MNSEFAYSLFPHKRNQDVIVKGSYFTKTGDELTFYSITDGWNNPEKMLDNKSGRIVATRVAQEFPKLFLKSLEKVSFKLSQAGDIAYKAANDMDKKVLSWYPTRASCVGTFLFEISNKTVIVAVGTITTLLWKNDSWEAPKEIGDYILDPNKYESGGQTFFGRGELKYNPLYTAKTDTLVVDNKTPIFVATDGLLMEKRIMTLEELNVFTRKVTIKDPSKFIQKLGEYIKSIRDKQKDDISIFIKI